MDTSFTTQIFTTLLALFVVCVLAWVSLIGLKRIQQGRGGLGGSGPNHDLRFVRALGVGAKERVVVVSYRGEELMLGVSAGGISLLMRQPIEDPTPPAPPAA